MGNLGTWLGDYLTTKDSRSTVDYAAAAVELFPPITRTGLFRCDTSRHFLDIFAALDDERVREVNILKPVRGGGSLIGDVHLSATLPKDRNPGPYMCVSQTDAEAKMHFMDRTVRNLKGNAGTRELLPDRWEWAEIRLTNGHTLYTGGPTLSNLQSKGVRYLRLDECWIYPAGRMAEAEARVGDYLKEELSKIIRISQAGPREGLELEQCEWRRAYLRGAIHEWEVACPHCGGFYEPVFTGQRDDGSFWGITWDHHKLPNGDWDINKCATSVRFECPHCKQPTLDNPRTKAEWNRTGRYKLTTEANVKRRSFHWESVIDFPWGELVELWLDACNAERRGDLKPKIQFYQKRRAIFKDEQSLLRGGLHFRRLTYEINSEWPEEKARFLTLDRQEEDLLWWTVRAWSLEKSRRLGFGKCYGFAAAEKLRQDFKVQPNHTFCDSGYMAKGDNGVYAACIEYGWVAVRGAPEHDFIHRIKSGSKFRLVRKSYAPLSWADPGSGTHDEGRRYCPLVLFSKPQMNQLVQRLIDSGAWEEPLAGVDSDMEKEYNAQMGSRIKKVEFNTKTNEARTFWYEGKNDHARDLANEQCLGAVLGDLIPDPCAEKLSKREEKEQSESVTAA